MSGTGEEIRSRYGLILAVALAALLLVVSAPRAAAAVYFQSPGQLATDPVGNVYVTDVGKHRVIKLSPRGRYLNKLGGKGAGEGQIRAPMDVATDSGGNVYVVDSASQRVLKFGSSGSFVLKWGGEGSAQGKFGANPKGSQAPGGPFGIAVDAAGYVYVNDAVNFRIQKFTSDGAFVEEWGGETLGERRYPGNPLDVAAGPAGDIYVTDYGNGGVYRFSSNGGFRGSWRVPSVGGLGPFGVATDSAGRVFVADSASQHIEKFTAAGKLLREWGGQGTGKGKFDGGFSGPTGIATDRAGHVYASEIERKRIFKFSSNGRFLAQWSRRTKASSPKRLTIPTTARKTIFRARCTLSTRCRAMVRIFTGRKTLARGAYSVPAHSNRKVGIPLTKVGRRTMARKGRAAARLTIVDTRTHKRETIAVLLKRRG